MPTLSQFHALKMKNSNAILLFKIGDFYECFYEDAATLSKGIGLTLTTRKKKGEPDSPMAGFPYHQLDPYMAKLIAMGHKVTVCEID